MVCEDWVRILIVNWLPPTWPRRRVESRHRPVSPSERLLSTELVPIMPLYAVATGPIIADQLSS